MKLTSIFLLNYNDFYFIFNFLWVVYITSYFSKSMEDRIKLFADL